MTEVSKNLGEIYARKRAAVYALCLYYAALVHAEFVKRQLNRDAGFWTNQTRSAALLVFADAFSDRDEIGFFLAHTVEYGVYLELANDRQNEALRPLIEEFFPKFRADLEAIYAD